MSSRVHFTLNIHIPYYRLSTTISVILSVVDFDPTQRKFMSMKLFIAPLAKESLRTIELSFFTLLALVGEMLHWEEDFLLLVKKMLLTLHLHG